MTDDVTARAENEDHCKDRQGRSLQKQDRQETALGRQTGEITVRTDR